jgi:hypothetical protein
MHQRSIQGDTFLDSHASLSYLRGKESTQDVGRKPLRIPSSGYAHLAALLLLLVVVVVLVVVLV